MGTRVVSGLIGAILVVTVLIFNQSVPISMNLVVGLICFLSTYELFGAMGIKKLFLITIPSMIFSTILPLYGYSIIWRTALYIYTFLLFCVMIFLNNRLNFKDIGVIYSVTLLITMSLSTIVGLRNYGGNIGTFYLLFALSISWLSDTGAYFCGKLFGRNKLCPDLSPKKTIEGAIGGMVVCMLSSITIGIIFEQFIFDGKATVNYSNLLVISFVGSLISIMGDLSFSAIKRSCHVKDFGNVIPGHGGVLDRFDSVIFVVPFVYIILKYLNVLNIQR